MSVCTKFLHGSFLRYKQYERGKGFLVFKVFKVFQGYLHSSCSSAFLVESDMANAIIAIIANSERLPMAIFTLNTKVSDIFDKLLWINIICVCGKK